MAKKSKKKELTKATGKLPTDDKATFKDIVGSLIKAWDIKRPQEVMLVNRMTSTWMKMRKIEELLSTYDIAFEQRNDRGELIGMKVNQLAYYLKSLESDFRGYYKVLEDKFGKLDDGIPKDFIELLNEKK